MADDPEDPFALPPGAEPLDLELPPADVLLQSLLGDDGEPRRPPEAPQKPGKKRGRKSRAELAAENPDARTLARRKRQREAAARCRAKKAAKLRELEQETEGLRAANGALAQALVPETAPSAAERARAEALRAVATQVMDLVPRGADLLERGLKDLVTDDFTLINPDSGRLVGVPACMAYWRQLLLAVPDLQVQVRSVTPDKDDPGRKVVCEWVMEGTHSGGPLLSLPSSGRRIRMPGLNVFSFRGARISEALVSFRAGLLVAVLLGSQPPEALLADSPWVGSLAAAPPATDAAAVASVAALGPAGVPLVGGGGGGGGAEPGSPD